MFNRFPPNADPNVCAFTGAIVGAILSADFNSYELNVIGNWLELVGQYTLAAAAQMQLNNYRQSNNQNFNTNSNNQDIDNLKKAVEKILEEIDSLKQ